MGKHISVNAFFFRRLFFRLVKEKMWLLSRTSIYKHLFYYTIYVMVNFRLYYPSWWNEDSNLYDTSVN